MDKSFSDLVKESIEDEEARMQDKENEKKAKSSFIDISAVKKRVRRNFFIGFGLGLILSAAAMWLFQPLSKEEVKEVKEKEVSEMKNSEIIEAAKKLGMVFETKEENANEINVAETSSETLQMDNETQSINE